QDLAELLVHPSLTDPIQERQPRLVLVPGVGVNHVPFHRHRMNRLARQRSTRFARLFHRKSNPDRMRAETPTVTNTTTVAAEVSLRVGQVTFSSSWVTS